MSWANRMCGTLGAAVVACGPGEGPVDRSVVVYTLQGCPVSQATAFAMIYGRGDFEVSADHPVASSLPLREQGSVLDGLSSNVRSLLVDVSEPGESRAWRGVREVPPQGPANILVWPVAEACNFTNDVGLRTNPKLTTFDRHVMVLGGVTGTSQVPRTFVGDLDTGVLGSLAQGLRTPRIAPSVTAFATSADETGALVAGGEALDTGAALDTAEVYVPHSLALDGNLGDFDRERILLSGPRKDHAAVVLASGETLLVGGQDASGTLLHTMEIVSPVTREVRTENVARLAVGRRRPSALRLATGEVLVSGGTDEAGNEVGALEWFSPDASRSTKRSDLVTGRRRAVAPLSGGGALAVVAPTNNTPNFQTVWVISADGTPESATPIEPQALSDFRLFEGSAGAPILWTGTRWARWQPWAGSFAPLSDGPAQGPRCDGATCAPSTNGDAGLALWLDASAGSGMFLTGFRFDTKTQFDQVRKPLLVDGPEGLAPDRLAGQAGSSLRFELGQGLTLGPGASAFLPDATFADVRVEIDVVRAPPILVFRDVSGRELEVGGGSCALTAAATNHISAARRGSEVLVTVDYGVERPCPAQLPDGVRVSIGLRGSAGSEVSTATNLQVWR